MSHFFVFFFHSFPYTKRPIFWKVEFVLDAFYTKRKFFCGHYCDSKVILYPDLSVSLVKLNFVTHSNFWWLQDTTRPNNGHIETFFYLFRELFVLKIFQRENETPAGHFIGRDISTDYTNFIQLLSKYFSIDEVFPFIRQWWGFYAHRKFDVNSTHRLLIIR